MSNLRLATRSENKQNTIRPRSGNKTGVTGVFFNAGTGKYQAYVSVDKKMRHLGCYDTLEKARDVRLAAEKAHYPFSQLNL